MSNKPAIFKFISILLVMTFVIISTFSLVLAAYVRIEGDPIAIEVEDDGQMGVWFKGRSQYYRYARGSFLFLNGTSLDYDFGSAPGKRCDATNQFTPVSNTLVDPWTIETVFEADGGNVRVTQITEYINGNSYYKITWTIENVGTQSYTDNRFLHGGDNTFGGSDSAKGHWDPNLRMVYLTNPDPSIDGIMGFYGGTESPADHYYEGSYSSNWRELCSGDLPDTVNPDLHDANYSLEWDKTTLAPGDIWTIVAYEKWTEAGFVQVLTPPGQSGNPTDVFTYTFTIHNLQAFQDTFDLSAISSEGWSVSLPDGNTVTVGADANASVTVELSPEGACGVDTLPLTATSQTDSNVTNNDSVQTNVACPSPEIDILGNGQSIPNGSTIPATTNGTDFGSVAVGGAPITHTFTISNSGGADLNLTSTPAVTLTNGTYFSVSTQPISSTIAPGNTATFAITFDPVVAGTFTDTVTIANNDTDENPYTFAISGMGIVTPEITVAPMSLTFGSQDVDAGATISQMVVITNDGTADLNISSVSLTGGDASQFVIESDSGETTLTPGSSRTAQVSFDPSTTGSKSANLSIVSDDSDEGTVDVALGGTGTTVTIFYTYLPVVITPSYPDLVVELLMVTGNNVQVVIKNQGTAVVNDAFWVDVYINPDSAPTGVNQTWVTNGGEGLVWGVTVSLNPGETITLTVGGAYYLPNMSYFGGTIPAGSTVYAQVDSFNSSTTYGAVLENHEVSGGVYNNIASTVTAATISIRKTEQPPALLPETAYGQKRSE